MSWICAAIEQHDCSSSLHANAHEHYLMSVSMLMADPEQGVIHQSTAPSDKKFSYSNVHKVCQHSERHHDATAACKASNSLHSKTQQQARKQVHTDLCYQAGQAYIASRCRHNSCSSNLATRQQLCNAAADVTSATLHGLAHIGLGACLQNKAQTGTRACPAKPAGML